MSGGRGVRAGSARRRVVAGVAVSSLVLVGTAVSAYASSTATPVPSAQCEVEELELPSGPQDIMVVGGDPTGRYIVGLGMGVSDSVLWTDGAVEKLTGPHDNPEYPNGVDTVNGSGVVVGNTTVGNDSTDPWTYEAGTYTDLQNESAGDWASDINADGDVIGFAWDSGEIPMVWPAGDYENPQQIPSPAGAAVRAISDSGAIVGYEERGNGQSYPYYWPDATSEGERLELPDGVESGYALDLAGDWVVGGSGEEGIRWNLRDGSVELLPAGLESVNSAGDASGGAPKIYRADGSTLDLPAPGGAAGPPHVAVVFERGAAHAAAGSYEKADGRYVPVVWSC